jgi:hypothetical protein
MVLALSSKFDQSYLLRPVAPYLIVLAKYFSIFPVDFYPLPFLTPRLRAAERDIVVDFLRHHPAYRAATGP